MRREGSEVKLVSDHVETVKKFYTHCFKQQTEIIKLKFLKSHSGELMRGVKSESGNTI